MGQPQFSFAPGAATVRRLFERKAVPQPPLDRLGHTKHTQALPCLFRCGDSKPARRLGRAAESSRVLLGGGPKPGELTVDGSGVIPLAVWRRVWPSGPALRRLSGGRWRHPKFGTVGAGKIPGVLKLEECLLHQLFRSLWQHRLSLLGATTVIDMGGQNTARYQPVGATAISQPCLWSTRMASKTPPIA